MEVLYGRTKQSYYVWYCISVFYNGLGQYCISILYGSVLYYSVAVCCSISWQCIALSVSAKTAPPQNFEKLKIQNVKSWEAEISPICLSDQINRLVKVQLLSFSRFGFRAFESIEAEPFLLKHPLSLSMLQIPTSSLCCDKKCISSWKSLPCLKAETKALESLCICFAHSAFMLSSLPYFKMCLMLLDTLSGEESADWILVLLRVRFLL